VFSLLLVFFSNVAPSDAWRARSAKAKQARRRVGETGDGVIVEEAEEAGSGACSTRRPATRLDEDVQAGLPRRSVAARSWRRRLTATRSWRQAAGLSKRKEE
jgi:hypothetical protein